MSLKDLLVYQHFPQMMSSTGCATEDSPEAHRAREETINFKLSFLVCKSYHVKSRVKLLLFFNKKNKKITHPYLKQVR